MSEVDEAIEKLEKRKKSEGTFKDHVLTLKLKPVFVSAVGKRWKVVLTVYGVLFDSETAHEKSFWRYESALKHYEQLKEKYGLEEKAIER